MKADEFKQYLANLPENLKNFKCFLEELEKGNCLAFVGAGLSKPLGIPGWEELVYQLSKFSQLGYSKECIERSLEKRLDVAEEAKTYWKKKKSGLNKYYNFIKEMCRPKNMPYSLVHKELLQVRFLSYLTTNFDNVLDNTAKDVNDGEMLKNTQILPNFDPTLLRMRKLFYLHGKIENHNIVLAKSEYDKAYRDKGMENLLWNAYSNMTIVMIGYRLEDPYIQKLFQYFSEQLDHMRRDRKELGTIESENKHKHFVLEGTHLLQSKATSRGKDERKRMIEKDRRYGSLNVCPIRYLLRQRTYSPGEDGHENEDDHINLFNILKELPKHGGRINYEA